MTIFSKKHNICDIDPRILADAIKIHPKYPNIKEEYKSVVKGVVWPLIENYVKYNYLYINLRYYFNISDPIIGIFIFLYGKKLFTNAVIPMQLHFFSKNEDQSVDHSAPPKDPQYLMWYNYGQEAERVDPDFNPIRTRHLFLMRSTEYNYENII
ncbi:hypothetical protein ACTFIY_004571 [Dictyostelium cf. discoideum]